MGERDDATERFAALLAAPGDVPLDLGALLIAAHAHPDLDVDGWRTRLDDLATSVADARDAVALSAALFDREGFRGNVDDYADPRNSFLDDVLARRLGIPITLTLVMIETGRRLGVPIIGIGMPGHFLARDGVDESRYFDPFHGGAVLDERGCRALFAAVHGSAAGWHPSLLAPVDGRSILFRMLTNLELGYGRRRAPEAAWAARLRLLFEDAPVAELRRSAEVLGTCGRYAEAAAALDALAARVAVATDEVAPAHRDALQASVTELAAEARGWRARAN